MIPAKIPWPAVAVVVGFTAYFLGSFLWWAWGFIAHDAALGLFVRRLIRKLALAVAGAALIVTAAQGAQYQSEHPYHMFYLSSFFNDRMEVSFWSYRKHGDARS